MTFKRIAVVATVVVAGLAILSCGRGNRLEDFSDKTPALNLEEFFVGQTRAWGLFEDRFGRVRRQFTVDIEGVVEDDTLTLIEDFVYDDGEEERRIWTLKNLGDGRYSGTAPDVIGAAEGQVSGNALRWRYSLRLPVGDDVYEVDFDDWMFLQDGDVLINRAEVTKWGFDVGEVTLFFQRVE